MSSVPWLTIKTRRSSDSLTRILSCEFMDVMETATPILIDLRCSGAPWELLFMAKLATAAAVNLCEPIAVVVLQLRFGSADAVEVDESEVTYIVREMWRGRSARDEAARDVGRGMWRSMNHMCLTR